MSKVQKMVLEVIIGSGVAAVLFVMVFLLKGFYHSASLSLSSKDEANSGFYPGRVITNSIGMKLVYIPAGEFMMGSPSDEKDRGNDEGPQHKVKIGKGFYMGVYEVTQPQWKQVMGTTVKQQRDRANPSWLLYGRGSGYPMYYVSWYEAADFCEILSRKEGKIYRLPTEAEWEYACRAGTNTRFYYGNDLSYSQLREYAWYANISENKTHPVGKKKPNTFGLYDMQGNLWEWCQDWYDKNYYGNSPESDPQGPGSGSSRVLRGASWYDGPGFCRAAFRVKLTPDKRYYDCGFRVILDIN